SLEQTPETAKFDSRIFAREAQLTRSPRSSTARKASSIAKKKILQTCGQALGSRAMLEFKFHGNNGETKTKPRKSTKASGRSSIPDTYCRVFASLEGSQLLLIVEYKAPHKLKRRMVKAALASMADMNLDGDVIRAHRQEQNIIAAACRHHPGVCGNGVQRDPIWVPNVDTGEVMIFLHINDNDPSIVEYHLCDPSSDVVGDDDKMDFSAVPQLFAFTVQAMKARETTEEWKTAAASRDAPQMDFQACESNSERRCQSVVLHA
ncbi:hypothetical protein E4U22_003036, partial [Claviceps purpurea]